MIGKNKNAIYCKGIGCALKNTCLFYIEGRHIHNHFRWMDNCDPETRECYLTNEKHE